MKTPAISLLLALATLAPGPASRAQSGGAPGEYTADAEAAVGGMAFGEVAAPDGERLDFAGVLVHYAADSSVAKVAVTETGGRFEVGPLEAGSYYATVDYVGLAPLTTERFAVAAGSRVDLGVLTLPASDDLLAEAVVTARRAVVEVSPERTVFNVAGTVTAASGDGLALLRRAPGVTVSEGGAIAIAGRPGTVVYVDGKRSPLTGAALVTMLRNLPADRVDRVEVIANPGSRFDAEGAGGVVDIRLRRAEGHGTNGSLSVTGSRGRAARGAATASANHRGPRWDSYVTLGASGGRSLFDLTSLRSQRGVYADEVVSGSWDSRAADLRIGMTVDLGGGHTLGAVASGTLTDEEGLTFSEVGFGALGAPADSVLVASTNGLAPRRDATGNLNYRFGAESGVTVGVDVDYGTFASDDSETQPNLFRTPGGDPLAVVDFYFETPSEVSIASAQVDLGVPLAAGRLEAGAKVTQVATEQDFSFNQDINGERVHFAERSSEFAYDERVSAAYADFSTGLVPSAGGGHALEASLGIRVEHTDTRGRVASLAGEPLSPETDRDYVNLFPHASLGWSVADGHRLDLGFGRRVRRPDFNALTPFVGRLNAVSAQVGEPTLRPELVNALDLTYTLAGRYTARASLSRAGDQITHLTRPAGEDPRGTFAKYGNLESQTVASLTLSAPAQLAEWWEAYATVTGLVKANRGTFDEVLVPGAGTALGGRIDERAASVNATAQSNFSLPGGWRAELSGYFRGPGLSRGARRLSARGTFGFGVQRRLWQDRLDLRVGFDDPLLLAGYTYDEAFAGQELTGGRYWDSRRGSLSLRYDFGHEGVKATKRSGKLGEAARRTGH